VVAFSSRRGLAPPKRHELLTARRRVAPRIRLRCLSALTHARRRKASADKRALPQRHSGGSGLPARDNVP
jgi:hypothetical protein